MIVMPYHTTIATVYKNDRLVNELQRMAIIHPFPALTTPLGHTVRDAVVVTPWDEYLSLPGFTQPFNLGNQQHPKWIIDGRPYMRWDRRNDSYRLTAENDYSFQCARLALTQIAEDEGAQSFRRLGDLPVKTFIRWVTLGISQRYNLALEDQIRVQVLCAYYYHAQLTDDGILSHNDRHRLANQVSRVTAVPTPQVIDIVEPIVEGGLVNGPAFANCLATHSGSVRLNQLKFTDLFMLLANSWVGVNSRENVGVALEHLPTFLTMVYMGLGERSYRKTMMTRRAETAGRQQDHKQFVTQVYRLVESRFN